MPSPAALNERRANRRHKGSGIIKSSDTRDNFARDRDRILYTAAFRRLAHITQVVGPHEGYAVHNRLTHVLKVAQIGRRIAERLIQNTPSATLIKLGGLNADVVETAALAHDLGHPPFGHIAEKELNRLARKAGLRDGYEGNAQSFRIVSKLEIRELGGALGLNLTRASLNAILKYPWFKGTQGKKAKKWGVYDSEREDFRFARVGAPSRSRASLEAQIMDWADDIAYSVHDVEDFYRAGRIPLHILGNISNRGTKTKTQSVLSDEAYKFLAGVYRRQGVADKKKQKGMEEVFGRMARLFPPEPYSDTAQQRAFLRFMASFLISRFDRATSINPSGLHRETWAEEEVDLLKQLVWHYVIEHQALATQQHGQIKIIRELFETYFDAAEKGDYGIFPETLREQIEVAKPKEKKRGVIDLIAGFTEQQAIEMHQRLNGSVAGTAFKACQ